MLIWAYKVVIKNLLIRIRSYSRLLISSLKSSSNRNSKIQKKLPTVVSGEEMLARNLIGGNSKKSVKKLFDPDNGTIKPSRFLDKRNPTEISVNRISTLSEREAHQLGIAHKDETNKTAESAQTYHGYAAILAQTCYDAECHVRKDDEGGTKPYHANIVYPKEQKYDDMEIAVVLATKATLIRYKVEDTQISIGS